MRIIVATLGQHGRDMRRLGTSTTTNGVHGMIFNVDDCSAGGPGCGDLPPGVYVGVTDGSVEVANPAGRIIVGVGQYAITPSHQAPKPTANPGLVFSPPKAFAGPGARGPRAQDCVIRRSSRRTLTGAASCRSAPPQMSLKRLRHAVGPGVAGADQDAKAFAAA